jgi:hypothetical protein
MAPSGALTACSIFIIHAAKPALGRHRRGNFEAGNFEAMATAFDRDQLLAAFDEIGRAVVSARAPEFRSRNIFNEERPLRRARSGLERP